MLEKLVDKFVQEPAILEKEMDSKYAHEMLMAELKKSIEEATEDRSEKAANSRPRSCRPRLTPRPTCEGFRFRQPPAAPR
jgi:hypothetical protein